VDNSLAFVPHRTDYSGLSTLKRLVDRDAFASLFFSRTVYAINWYNVAALYTFIARDFDLNVSGLGIATSSFYAGVGLFQVPGGILAAKYGARKVAAAGMLTSSIAVLLTSLTTTFNQLVLLRFLVGIGIALFFGPGVTLIARTFRGESEGFGVGTFQSAFYVGGILGLFTWSVMAEVMGWRAGLGVSGGLGVLGGVLLLLCVPAENVRESFKVKTADLRKILSDKWLVLLSLELFGFGTGTITISTFMVYYLEQFLHLIPALAGIIGGLAPLFAIISSPTLGSLYDKAGRARILLFLLGACLASAIALVAMGTVTAAIVSALLTGVGSGSFTVGYLAGRAGNAGSKEYESLVVSWVNAIQMISGLWAPLLFSMVVISFGYGASWLVAAGATLLLTCVILLAKEPRPFK
jgi:MFS family permease